MKTSVVIVTALRDELDSALVPHRVPVVYSGIGKINAAMAVLEAIGQYRPELIVNFGTAGKISKDLSGLVPIGRVVQRDMMALPLAPRGQVPFSQEPHELFSLRDGFTCGSGDSFVTAEDDWLVAHGVDVVDMELFAIAAVARRYNLPWMSWKYISDEANEDSGQAWSKQVSHGQELFIDEFKKL
jgi:adenosylhomocysteine nucleosidase